MEVALVGKTQSKSDFYDRRMSMRELGARGVNARPAHEFTDRTSMLPPKDARDVHFVNAGDRRRIFQTDRLRETCSQRFFDTAEPWGSGRARNRLTSCRCE